MGAKLLPLFPTFVAPVSLVSHDIIIIEHLIDPTYLGCLNGLGSSTIDRLCPQTALDLGPIQVLNAWSILKSSETERPNDLKGYPRVYDSL